MSDLAEFLLARIAEDEAVAQAAIDVQGACWYDEEGVVSSDIAPIDAPGRSLHMYAPEGRWMLWDCEGSASLGVHPATSAHIARYDPDRALAEADAKRRLLDLHCLVTVDYAGQWWTDPAPPGTYVRTGCANCTSCGVDGDEYIEDGLCETLRLLVLPYTDHEDYRDDWAPVQMEQPAG